MNIEFIDSYYDSLGGAPKSMLTLCKHLIDKGHDVTLTSLDDGRVTEEANSLGVKIITTSKLKPLISRNSLNVVLFLNFIRHLFSTLFTLPKDKDVVCINEPKSLYYYFFYILFLRIFKNKSCQLIYYVRINEKLKVTNFLLVRLCQKIILISNDSKRAFGNKDLSVFESKFFVIHTGFDFPKYERLKADSDSINLCAVGTFCDRKNQLLILESIKLLKQNTDNFQLHFFGGLEESQYFSNLKMKIEEYKLKDNVVFHGYSENIIKDICQFDVYIMSSKLEGLPRSVIEALYSGLYVISVKCDGISDIIKSEFQGVVLNHDERLIVNEIIKFKENSFLNSNSTRLERSNYINETFSTEKYVDNFLSMIGANTNV